ncbi:hypothetical protein U136B_003 [Escherichia phage U136B]|uniref:Uncharacterized protein n=1 Tax=Escherichia phage U136B TaxID=2812882 RepID=A0A894JXA8_9CAUD|nr:hypothetical protein U136B_003 [Escherichia phage U136B]
MNTKYIELCLCLLILAIAATFGSLAFLVFADAIGRLQ